MDICIEDIWDSYEENNTDLYQDKDDTDLYKEHRCCNCMDCLGMSWADFM